MSSETMISDPVDPLSGLSGPSLFRRSIRASTDVPLLPDSKTLDSIHQFMKSVEGRSPEKLLEEAKAIVDGGSELLNSKFAAFTASLGIDDSAPAKGNEKPQERRPGLGRKRARFSLKINSSQPPESLKPSLDIDHLQDPEEFFSQVEKLENAKKEIERQTGGNVFAMNDNNLLQNARQRRPGILGKSVTYRHRYSSVMSASEETLTSSQELFEPNVFDPPNPELHHGTEDSDVEIQETDAVSAITKTESKVNKILDELLATNCEDLDGNGALSILQERLHIKPIELSTLSLPDFQDVGKTNYMALEKKLPKLRRTSLAVQSMSKTSKETSINHKQTEESPGSSLASPTPPKSPFTSLSLLKKRILQSNPMRDPFSPLNIDISPQRILSSANQVDSQPDKVNDPKIFCSSDKLKPLSEDESTKPTISMASDKSITGGLDSWIVESMDKNSCMQNSCVDVSPTGSGSNLGVHDDCYISDKGGLEHLNAENRGNDNFIDGPDKAKEYVEDGLMKVMLKNHDVADDSTKSALATDVHGSSQIEDMPAAAASAQADATTKDCTIDILPAASASNCQLPKIAHQSSATDVHGSSQVEEHENLPIEDMLQAAASAQKSIDIESSKILNNLDGDARLFEATTKDCTLDMLPAAHASNSEQETEKLPSKNRPQKRKGPLIGRNERKTLSRRPSIADAGTSFETGVRRSKRIKMRPLEYWKGERFLYGRVNDSLKLIGLKYISPSKDEGKLKVKSYIPHDYNELLELAAKH